jgi:hypothetical protein
VRKILLTASLAASAILPIVGPAFAGGMGDSSAHIREMNAICEKQKRGEAPLHPNLCLPEYPPDYAPRGPARHGQ